MRLINCTKYLNCVFAVQIPIFVFMFENPQFQKMDELSEKKEPFFFLINFLMDEIRIFTKNEIENNALLIDFPNITNDVDYHTERSRSVEWK